MMDLNLPRQYRHFKRYRDIAQILLKNGLGFLIEKLDLGKFLPFKQRFQSDKGELNQNTIAVRLKKVLQELGPAYIKLGQLLSTRADILSPEYVRELRKLQDKVAPVNFEQLEEVLIAELGENYSSLFKTIKEKPEAAASIAQIHRAVLKDGRDVIMKIQRPHIKEKIKVDLEIMFNIAAQAEERELVPDFIKPSGMISEFRESILQELNFKMEVSNIEKFRNNFRDNEHIIVPEIYNEYSTRRLIVMEEIKGVKLKDIEDSDVDIDNKFLAELGARALLKQVLIDGFFHADPHPGNIFVVGRDKLAYIDFGLIGQLTPEVQDSFAVLFFALMRKNVDIIVDTLIEIGVTPGKLNVRKFKLDIQDLLNRYYGVDLSEIDFKQVTDDFQRIIYRHRIQMPQDFFLLGRAIAVSEGVGYMIDPDFNIVKVGQEFLKELVRDRLKPGSILRRLVSKLWGFRSSTRGLPGKMRSILDKVISDELSINFIHRNLESLINQLDIVTNRLSISLIISSLIIGSSMILQTDMSPTFFEIPLLGLLGYVIAGVFGFWLVIDILRSGKY
ncbi:MAG: ABC1 kinase family protein [Halanaerobiaceae bacterium]